jgi:Leucine-rich repeat (LRR) protein
VAADEKAVMLYGGFIFGDKRQFINKLDGTLATLRNCERLALSTNQIDRMTPFTGMENLRLLSLSRNAIKKIERLEDVANTLEELWISYNLISSLDGLGACQKLQVRGGGRERERAKEESRGDGGRRRRCVVLFAAHSPRTVPSHHSWAPLPSLTLPS